MKRIFRHKIISATVFFLLTIRLWSQVPYFIPADYKNSDYSEQLSIVTDRDIYFTGEQVWCSVRAFNPVDQSIFLSRMIYLELLDTLNTPLVRIKMPVHEQGSSTVFKLPDMLESGTYIIRAYTKWMDNFGPEYFAYSFIELINPFSVSASLPSGYVSEDPLPGADSGKTPEFIVTTGKDDFGKREKVSVSISTMPGINVKPGLTVSVVKSSLVTGSQSRLYAIPVKGKSIQVADTVILPELEGEFISGVILNRDTDMPLANCVISMSVVGRDDDCRFTKTNENGEFLFTGTDFSGPREIIIRPLYESSDPTYVELKTPFSTKYLSFNSREITSDTSSLEELNKAVVAMQVNSIYAAAGSENKPVTGYEKSRSFYGQASREVKFRDYIELNDIREVLKEILKEVSVTRQDGSTFLKVLSANAYEVFGNPALVLLDGVPVTDIEALLKIPSIEIESARIVNTRFFYSDLVFEGIVSFTSVKADLGHSVINGSSYRRLFEGYREEPLFISPDYSAAGSRPANIPDFRNTLFWAAELDPDDEVEKEVVFYTGDETGEFTVIVTGFSREGKRITGKTTFRVLK